jgi:hypothetical protein
VGPGDEFRGGDWATGGEDDAKKKLKRRAAVSSRKRVFHETVMLYFMNI